MRQRSWIGVGALALIVAGSAASAGRAERRRDGETTVGQILQSAADRVGAPGPAGHLEQRHHHAARAAEGSRGPRVPERPGVGGAAKDAATRAEKRPDDPLADVELAYNNEWWDRGVPLKRTSLITDPPNGMLPPLTAEGQKAVAAREAARRSHGPADWYTDRPLQERCILYHGVPPFPTATTTTTQSCRRPTPSPSATR